MRVRSGPARRAGYTLVELMIVIAIIAVLASLLLGAVNRARDSGKRVTASTEMSQLEAAVVKFKTDFGFNPPQYVKFPTPGSTPASGTPEEKTVRLLQKMFRGYDPADTTITFTFRGTAPTNRELFGVQALAYFLGGPNLSGFKPNRPEAPPVDSNSVKGPYYDFGAARFINPETKADSIDYRDPWGTPYAYFSTTSGNTYDATYTWAIPSRPGAVLGAFRSAGAASPWANPSGVQLISAGPDQEFGTPYTGTTRGEWVPGQGEYTDTSAGGFGADDISNFNGGAPLGVKGK